VNKSVPLNHKAANQLIESSTTTLATGITATPATISFYDQFYPRVATHLEQPKTGMLHWVGTLIKKGRQKIALLSPQKFF
jgi:hypothetical protein